MKKGQLTTNLWLSLGVELGGLPRPAYSGLGDPIAPVLQIENKHLASQGILFFSSTF